MTGLVTAVAAGNAVITASAAGHSATANLSVITGGVIGASGGTISIYGGAATLAVPAQALTTTTRIEISSPQVNDATIIPGTVFEIGPGTFTFARAVVLTWQYDPARLPTGMTEGSLALYALVGANWDPRTTQVDTTANTLTAFLGTTGRYAFILKPVKFVQLLGTMPELAIGVGQKRSFEARTYDTTAAQLSGRRLTWTSSNTSSAVVNAVGEITGVSPGEVTITVTSEGISAAVNLSVLPRATADWANVTEWTTFQGSARRAGFVDVTVDLAAIRQLWSVPIGATGFSGPTYMAPAIGSGTVVISSGGSGFNAGFVGGFDAATGSKKWERRVSRYAPAFGHGRFYMESFDSLFALNPADGNVMFGVPGGGAIGDLLDAAPMAVDDAVYTSHGGLRRFNSSTLTQVWSQTVSSHASIASGLMYVFGTSNSNTGVTAFHVSTGQVAFEVAGNTESSMRGRTPVLGSMNNVIGICGVWFEYGGRCLTSFDLTTRTQAWTLPMEFDGTPSVGQGVIYVTRRNFNPEFRTSIEAHRENDGQLLWSWFPPPPQPFFPPPNPKGEVIVTRNLLIVGMSNSPSSTWPGETWIVDLATRKQLGKFPGGRLAISGQGVLYIASAATGNTGTLIAVSLQ